VQIDRYSGQLRELDIEGIVDVRRTRSASAADHASVDQRQRFQQLFVPKDRRSTAAALLEPA